MVAFFDNFRSFCQPVDVLFDDIIPNKRLNVKCGCEIIWKNLSAGRLIGNYALKVPARRAASVRMRGVRMKRSRNVGFTLIALTGQNSWQQ